MLLLAGCVPQPVENPAEPAPSSAPVFASEEEALAAAVAAYEEYLKVSDEIAADGGANPERLKDLVTEEWYEVELEGFASIRDAGISQIGATHSRNAVLQSYTNDSPGEVRLNICADTSETRFLNATGADVTSQSRKTLVTVEAIFSLQAEDLLLDGNEPWAEDSLC
ncbi:MAG: hypothetical protein ACOH19_13110 [Rhodoglobus sp.]